MKEANGMLVICLIFQALVFITQGQSLDLTVNRTPGQTTCANLRCSIDAPTDGSTVSFTKITIYNVANSKKRIAYKVQDENLFINSTKISDVTGTAYLSRNHAHLTLNFQNEAECINSKFECEVNFLTSQGQSGHISTTEKRVATNAGYKSSHFKNCLKGNVHTSPRAKFLLWGSVEAICDTETDGGGWVIIQRRINNGVLFRQNWKDYKTGFGNTTTNFWFGLDNIHNLTSQGYTVLRVDLEYQGKKYFAQYSTFRVGDELSKYQLTVSGYTGTAGDALNYHNGMKFTTYDRDNDLYGTNCATDRHGGWWYNACQYSNLNGIWASNTPNGMTWTGIVNPGSVSFSEMKVRRA